MAEPAQRWLSLLLPSSLVLSSSPALTATTLGTMPKVPSLSPATGKSVPSHFIHTVEANFVDDAGRTVLLRGVNLSGDDKAPLGHPSQVLDDFYDSAENGGESFVGRPLNIDDGSADVHLTRLRGWGFNMLRYVVTWEALEHSGP